MVDALCLSLREYILKVKTVQKEKKTQAPNILYDKMKFEADQMLPGL